MWDTWNVHNKLECVFKKVPTHVDIEDWSFAVAGIL